jgi:hypothetical protein
MNVDILTQILSFYDAITNYNVYSKVNKEWRKASLLVLMNPENLLTEEFEHDHAIELKNEGNIYFKDKEYKKAIASYTYSLAFDDKLLETFTNRTVAYLHIADYQNAYNDAMHVTKIAPDNFKGWYRMAIVLKLCGYPFDEALRMANSLGASTNLSGTTALLNPVPLKLDYFPPSIPAKIKEIKPIPDISKVANLCYVSVDQFLKKYNYQLYPDCLYDSFKLTSSFVLDDVMLCKIAKENPTFTKIEISGCQNVTYEGLQFCLEKYWKNVLMVDVRECKFFKPKDVKMLENMKIKVIFTILSLEDKDYYEDQMVFFREDPQGLLELLQLENNQNGFSATLLVSKHRKLSLLYHPDNNSGVRDKRLTILNDLMHDLLFQLRSLYSSGWDGKVLQYHGRTESTSILSLEN